MSLQPRNTFETLVSENCLSLWDHLASLPEARAQLFLDELRSFYAYIQAQILGMIPPPKSGNGG